MIIGMNEESRMLVQEDGGEIDKTVYVWLVWRDYFGVGTDTVRVKHCRLVEVCLLIQV